VEFGRFSQHERIRMPRATLIDDWSVRGAGYRVKSLLRLLLAICLTISFLGFHSDPEGLTRPDTSSSVSLSENCAPGTKCAGMGATLPNDLCGPSMCAAITAPTLVFTWGADVSRLDVTRLLAVMSCGFGPERATPPPRLI